MAGEMPLSALVRGVRAESGKSLSVALGVAERDSIVAQLQLKQEVLYYDYDWPALICDANVPLLSDGTRFYPFPTTISFDFVNDVWASDKPDTGFYPLVYGVGPEQFNLVAEGTTGWPLQRWQADANASQLEVWPVSSVAGYLRVTGRKALGPLVADGDMSTLNGTLLVLSVAADILARNKAEDAKVKMAQAQRHLRNIVRRQGSNKQNPIILGGGLSTSHYARLRPGIDYIPS
jgi:hypothetical protein